MNLKPLFLGFLWPSRTVVVLIDAYCTCVDIDATAAETVTPEIYTVISTLCLILADEMSPKRVVSGS